MDKTLPVVRIDDKNRIISEPELISISKIIKQTSVRISGKSIPTFETSKGLYMLAIGVDEIIRLLECNEGFMQVDRGSTVNYKYLTDFDAKLKMVILKDEKGREIREAVSGGRIESVKAFLRRAVSLDR